MRVYEIPAGMEVTTAVRHEQPEHERAKELLEAGRGDFFTPEFRQRPTELIRLSNLGRQRAQEAGAWLQREKVGEENWLTSDYIRAMEMLVRLGFVRCARIDPRLRERSQGNLVPTLPPDERKQRFAEALKRKERDPWEWDDEGAESLAALARPRMQGRPGGRAFETALKLTGRKYTGHSDHFRALLGVFWGPDYCRLLATSKEPHHQVRAGHIIQISLREPEGSLVEPGVVWRRLVCPWQESESLGWERTDSPFVASYWEEIVRSMYEPLPGPCVPIEQIRLAVERTPQLVY